MGLSCSHGFWSGPYSMFGRWRCALAHAAGYPVGRVALENGYRADVPLLDYASFSAAQIEGVWSAPPADALLVLLVHSDCSGEIAPAEAAALADRLEGLLPNLADTVMAQGGATWDGMPKVDLYEQWTRHAIEALRKAAKRGESIDFH